MKNRIAVNGITIEVSGKLHVEAKDGGWLVGVVTRDLPGDIEGAGNLYALDHIKAHRGEEAEMRIETARARGDREEVMRLRAQVKALAEQMAAKEEKQ